MKIVLSTYTFIPEIGGVATHVATLARAFAKAGHDTTVITTVDGPTGEYGYELVRNPDALTLTRLYAGADILILSNLSLKLIYPLLAMQRRFALWHHSESAFHLSHNPLSADRLRRAVRDRALHITTSTFIGSRSGLSDYIVIRPFIEPAPPEGLRFEQRSGALFAGRLEPEKGVLDLIARWPLICDQLGVLELRIVGGGSLAGEVERIASASNEIIYLGSLPQAQALAEMRRAEFSFVPSLWPEPFGLVALESIAAGAITICSNRGGLPEAVGDAGILYDPDNANSFLRALETARCIREEQRDPHRRSSFEARISDHLAGFSPANAVSAIVSAFAREPAIHHDAARARASIHE